MIVLISLGRLGTEKSLDELINRFAAAVKMRDDFVLLIVGDGPARAELEKQAKELGIANRVIFTGMVPPEKVHEYYQLGDIFVSASTSETQGLTYVEAAANRLPLLCKQDLCLRNVLLPGENGYEFTNEENRYPVGSAVPSKLTFSFFMAILSFQNMVQNLVQPGIAEADSLTGINIRSEKTRLAST